MKESQTKEIKVPEASDYCPKSVLLQQQDTAKVSDCSSYERDQSSETLNAKNNFTPRDDL